MKKDKKILSNELVNLDKKLQELDGFLIEVRSKINEIFWHISFSKKKRKL